MRRIAVLVALAIVAGGCVTLTPLPRDSVVDVQRFADATTTAYNLTPIRLTIEPASTRGIGGRYRQGNFYLGETQLNSGGLTALVAHELAHYVLGHDTPPPGASTSEFLRNASGDVQVRYVPPEIRYTWPLAVGAEWEQTVTREQAKPQTTETRSRACRVEAQESLTLRAGTFRAFRVACRNKQSGELILQAWYSPEVKNWVRDWRPVKDGAPERELIAYKLR